MYTITELTEPKLTITFLVDVEPKEVKWLWPGRIPLGKLTLLAGDPGLGKSYMALDIAARVSTGSPWPDEGEVCQGNVLIISAEDDLADTIRPRLDLLCADSKKIFAIEPLVTILDEKDTEAPFSLTEHITQLEETIVDYEATLLILDPILAFTGSRTDTHKSADVRAALAPLAKLAMNTECSILAVMHLNKKSTESNSIYRITGSLDFAAAARSVLMVRKYPDDHEGRVLTSAKSNLSASPSALRYRVTEEGFDWIGEVDIDADSVLNTATNDGEVAGALAEAEDYLRDILADGPMAAQEIMEIANQEGITIRTLKRAKKKLQIKAERLGKEGERGGGHWCWALPPVK